VDPDFSDLLREFSAAGVKYLLVGAHALAFHAEPRATGDLDVWVANDEENAQRVWAALTRFGVPMDKVTVTDFTSDDLIFQIGLPPKRIDVVTTIDGYCALTPRTGGDEPLVISPGRRPGLR
jgi:hypothetical protein